MHGLGLVPGEPDQVLVVTHDGLTSYYSDTSVQRISELSSDLMGFAGGPDGVPWVVDGRGLSRSDDGGSSFEVAVDW